MARPSRTLPDRSSDSRSDILNVARALFARKGYYATAIQDIANEASLNKAMIYYYYKNKEDLYLSVIRQDFQGLLDLWEDPFFAGSATSLEKVRCFLDRYFDFLDTHPELVMIVSRELSGQTAHLQWIVENYLQRNFVNLFAIVADGIHRGEFREVNPYLTTRSILGLIIFFFSSRPVVRLYEESPFAGVLPAVSKRDFIEHVIDLLHNGITHEKSA